ncbi:MAG: hypothetical protein GX811_08380 [Lentisphaerae bacterium]|nr:hypothetical protein [Lentisphaerota bacterium]
MKHYSLILILSLCMGISCVSLDSFAKDSHTLKNDDQTAVMEQLKSAKELINKEIFTRDKKNHDKKAEAKAHAEGVAKLDEIEAIAGLSENVLIELYQLRQVQFTKVKNDSLKYEEYTRKILDIPSCPESVKAKAQKDLADLGGPWRVMQALYVYCLPEDLINQRIQAFRKYAEEQIADKDLSQNPDLAETYHALARSYWESGENEKAEEYALAVFKQKDIQNSKVQPGRIGDAAVLLASIEVRRGNRDKARQYCQDLLDKNYQRISNSRMWYSVPGVHAAKAVRHIKDDYMPDLDNMKLPGFTDCKPYPQPQEPEYTDKYTQLKSVRFEGNSEFPKNHPVFRLVELKFKRYGIEIADNAPFTIKMNTGRHPSTPENSEGYYLEINEKEALISGNDFLGSVWGVVSFIQCVDSESAKVRNCKIRDWPVTPLRGCSGYGDNLVEFALFNKLNFFFNQGYYFLDAGLPDLDIIYENLKYIAKPFVDFGLEFYVADRTFMYPKLSLTSDRTFKYHLDRQMKLASYGANITVVLDDSRYPLNEIDAEVDDCKGCQIDNQYVQKLYSTVKAKYPDVKMVFCPTYYWGPHWRDTYIDTRAEYFKGMKTYLDPEIKVFWSGNQVRGYTKTEAQVQWFIDSAGRKPMVWQNAMGPHIRMNYGCEPINWTGWHYEGFFENDCEGYMANSIFPGGALALAHMAEALWKPEFYRESAENKENVLQRATDNLCGQGVYEVLRPAVKALYYMDKYLWSNGMALNKHLFEESLEELEELYETVSTAMEKAKAINPAAQLYSHHYGVPVGKLKELIQIFNKPRSFYNDEEYKKGHEANLKIAEKEAGLNTKQDLFGNAFDFHIGKPMIVDKRCAVQYYPKSPSVKGVWKFEPPELSGNYELKICGRLGQEEAELPNVLIKLNEKMLYEGPAKFSADGWTFMDFKISWDELNGKENQISVENISPREKWSKPLTYYINYAVLKIITE